MPIISSIAVFALKISLIIVFGFVIAKVVDKLLDKGRIPNKMVPAIATRPAVWIGFLGVAVLGFKFLLVLMVVLGLDVLASMDGGGTRAGRRTTLAIAAGLRHLDALISTHTDTETDKLNLYATRLELSQAYNEADEETESLVASLQHGIQIAVRRILDIDIDEITSEDSKTDNAKPGDVKTSSLKTDSVKTPVAIAGLGILVSFVAFGATVLIAGIGDTGSEPQDDMGTPPEEQEESDTITADDVEITIERNEYRNESSGDTGMIIIEFRPGDAYYGSNLRWEAPSYSNSGSDRGKIAAGEQHAISVDYYTQNSGRVTVRDHENRPIYVITMRGYVEDDYEGDPYESKDVVVFNRDGEIVQD